MGRGCVAQVKISPGLRHPTDHVEDFLPIPDRTHSHLCRCRLTRGRSRYHCSVPVLQEAAATTAVVLLVLQEAAHTTLVVPLLQEVAHLQNVSGHPTRPLTLRFHYRSDPTDGRRPAATTLPCSARLTMSSLTLPPICRMT